MADGRPRTSVIVVSWNGRNWLGRCLDALLAQQGDFEIIVVDNASTDGSAAFLRETYPAVRVHPMTDNAGFAAGNNAGARVAQATEFLAFLNNDTEVERGWLAALIAALERTPEAAMAAAHIVRFDPPGIIDSAGDGYLRAGGAFKRHHDEPERGPEPAGDPFGVCGAACLVRRAAFEALGGFDERFFMVYEDVDLSYRARLAGHRIIYVPEARVRHAGSASLGRISPDAVFYGQRNLEWAWLKNTPWPLLLRSAPAHAVYALSGMVHYARLGRLGPCLAGKLAALWGLPQVLRARRVVQAARVAAARDVWAAMTPGWLTVKRREKKGNEAIAE